MPPVHESIELQKQDVLQYPEEFASKILRGDACDQVAGAFGELGSIGNPIPVNGAFGEIKYLIKLRGKTGRPVFFHRIGSVKSSVASQSVDKYEVVCIDGSQWSFFHFDMYHPRRSNFAPSGFTLAPTADGKADLAIGFGNNKIVDNFPYGILPLLESSRTLPTEIVEVIRTTLKANVFLRRG